MAQDPEYGRRRFIKESVLSLARTAQEYVTHRDAPREEAAVQTFRADGLRPPGAVEESLFLERCTKCGDCVKACPYGSITLSQRDGTPEIFPDQHPCYLCHDFPCIASCGTDGPSLQGSSRGVRLTLMAILSFTVLQVCSQIPQPTQRSGATCSRSVPKFIDKIAIRVKRTPLLLP